VRPGVTFLNHGSFGACRARCSRPTSAATRARGGTRGVPGPAVARLLADARARLAAHVGAGADDLVFVPNATIGPNVVARSLDLQAGDEVVARTTSMAPASGPGASSASGWRALHRQPIPLPLSDPAE